METDSRPPAGIARGPLLAMAAFVALGAVLGPFFLPEDWPMARQILAGAAMGPWFGLLLTARRLMM